jgi:hypothetical protein
MTPSDELFNLIKSLTKSEKRYFKLASTLQSGSKNYIKLFDAILEQEEYDEEEIKKKFKNSTFIKHLPSEKTHLYNLILKSLRAFYADRSASSQLQEQLKNIEILYSKALYKECSKFIKRAKKLAYQHEKYYYLLELINWEKVIIEEEYLSGKFDKDLNELVKEEEECIAKLRNLAEYQVLYSKINYVFRTGGYIRNDEQESIVDEIANYHLIIGKNTAISVKATTACYYIKAMCAITKNDMADAEVNLRKVITVFDKNPDIIKEVPKRYIKTLNYLFRINLGKNNFKQCFEIIDKLEAMAKKPDFKSVDLQVMFFSFISFSKMLVYEAIGNFDKAIEMIEPIMQGIEEFGNKINKEEKTIFFYNFSTNYLCHGDLKKALHWINEVLNDPNIGLRKDVYTFARIVNLLIHFELGNHDLLEYEIPATERFIKKAKRNYKVETIILKNLKKLSSIRYRNNQQTVLSEFKKQLTEAFKDPYENATNKYFDIMMWVDSKLQRKSFTELIQESMKDAKVEMLEV